MANARFIFPNITDTAVVTASSEVASLTAANLQNQKRNYIWRSTDLSDQQINFNYGALQPVQAFVLARHNLTAAGSVRFRLWDDEDQTGNLLYDSGVVFQGSDLGWGEFDWGEQDWGGSSVYGWWAYAYSVLWFADEGITGAVSGRVDLSDAANPAGYMEASRLITGTYFEPGVNVSRGMSMEWVDDAVQDRAAGGALHSDDQKEPYRRWELRLGTLDEAERASVMEMAMRAGRRKDMFISVFPEVGGVTERDYGGLVKITSMPRAVNRLEDYRTFEASLVFEES